MLVVDEFACMSVSRENLFDEQVDSRCFDCVSGLGVSHSVRLGEKFSNRCLTFLLPDWPKAP